MRNDIFERLKPVKYRKVIISQDTKLFNRLKKALPDIKKNVLLRQHTTFKIGGPAEYFLIAKEKEDLIKAIKLAKRLKLPVFIFGGGSNLLVSDGGLKGLVVKIKNQKGTNYSKALRVKIKNNIITADAGTELKNLVELSAEKSLQGLEWSGGLPGTFGGAIRGNAGAFGGEIKDIIFEVEALDKNFNLRKLSNKQCQFSYRSSIFKKKNWIVLSATVKLKRDRLISLRQAKKNLRSIAQSHIKYRRDKHPWEYPNAGSIFKNCSFSKFSPKFKKSLLNVVKKDPFPIIPTAYLISELGLKGRKIGNAQISEKHPNFIVNLGDAKASDVLKLINLVKKKIKKTYGIVLEQEVQYLK